MDTRLVERIERLAAHIDEGLTLAHSDQVARRRLALLLFDSAVELMMYRESSYLLSQEELNTRLVRGHDQAVENGYQPSEDSRTYIDEMRQNITPAKKRREIDRYFDAKATYLGSAGLLQPGQVRVLRRLHKYRNEAYHEDQLRPHTLDSALRVYILVICDLLQNLPIHSLGYSGKPHVTPTVEKYLGSEGRTDFDTYQKLGRAILEREELASALAHGEALSDHFIYRLNDFDEAVDFIADWMSEVRRDGSWGRDDVLPLVQLEEGQLTAFATRQEILKSSPPVRFSHLTEWRETAGQLRLETDQIAAFATFADLEDAFEPIEHKVKDFAVSIEWAIQSEIDRMRGK